MQKISFNRDWRFHLNEVGRWVSPDDSTWRVLDLPHDWSIELERGKDEPSGLSNGFFPMGRAAYNKHFDAPEEWRGKKVFVEFEGVYMNAEVWLNENFLGRHPYGYTTFTFDLTPYLNIGEENILRVRVDNSQQLNSRWYSGSGIYRPVWLWVGEPVHIGHWGVAITTPQVSTESALVQVKTSVWQTGENAGNVTLRSRVVDANGTQVGSAEDSSEIAAQSSREFEQKITVRKPALWSPDSPALYILESEVLVNGTVLDRVTTPFGIRSISFSAEAGFLLNGQPLKLKGGCVHHDNGILGSASYARSEERKVEIHKASGYNAIRTAHNPPSPLFLDACDRLGMLVMDEAFDCWRDGKNPGDYHLSFDDWWQRDIAAMVLRDRNHPSVIMWSIGNEVMERDGRSGGANIAKMLADEVRRLDPTRPTTSAICGVWDKHRTWIDTDPVFATIEVGGYNYQWQQYADDHQRHPKRIMAGTESFPLEAFENWQQVTDNSYVIGDFVWTSLDYLGESGIGRAHYDDPNEFLGKWPWHQANCGDLDLTGFKRPQSFFRDQVWDTGEKLYIAVHTPGPEGKTLTISRWGWPDVSPNWNWPGKEGQTFKVDVYSRCETVKLYLNNELIGEQAIAPREKPLASFEVAYQPGVLKAVGFNGGEQVAVYAIQTTTEPAKVRLSPDTKTLKTSVAEQTGTDDLCYVTVDMVDESGCRVWTASNNLFFTVKGAGSILAVGSANPVSTEPYVGNQRKAFQGRCLVVLKAGKAAGEIVLRAFADGMDGDEVLIKVE